MRYEFRDVGPVSYSIDLLNSFSSETTMSRWVLSAKADKHAEAKFQKPTTPDWRRAPELGGPSDLIRDVTSTPPFSVHHLSTHQ